MAVQGRRVRGIGPSRQRTASIGGVVRYAGWLAAVPLAAASNERAESGQTDRFGQFTTDALPPGCSAQSLRIEVRNLPVR